jgi:hypothetical protein
MSSAAKRSGASRWQGSEAEGSAAQQIELECSNAQHIDQSAGATIEQAPKSHRKSL